MNPGPGGSLELGRDAVKRHAWTEGLEAFTAADREGGLSADDLEQMGEAAWWAGKPDEASDAMSVLLVLAAYSYTGNFQSLDVSNSNDRGYNKVD